MRRWMTLSVVALITVVLFYLSRFWYLRLWSRDGLYGIKEIRPEGGLLARWLRGTDAAPFELLIWAIAFFAVLTIAQRLYDKLPKRSET